MAVVSPSWSCTGGTVQLVVDYRCPFAYSAFQHIESHDRDGVSLALYNLNMSLCTSVDELLTNPRHTAALRATRATVAVGLFAPAEFAEVARKIFDSFHRDGISLYRASTLNEIIRATAEIDLATLTSSELNSVDDVIADEHRRLTMLSIDSVPSLIHNRTVTAYDRNANGQQFKSTFARV